MKKLFTVLLTVLLAFTTLTFNVAAENEKIKILKFEILTYVGQNSNDEWVKFQAQAEEQGCTAEDLETGLDHTTLILDDNGTSVKMKVLAKEGFEFDSIDNLEITVNGTKITNFKANKCDTEQLVFFYNLDLKKIISEINFTGIKELPGTDLTTPADLNGQVLGVNVGQVTYKNIEGGDPRSEIKGGKDYRVAIGFNAEAGYVFSDDLKVTVNGSDPLTVETAPDDGSKKVKYEFGCIGDISEINLEGINELPGTDLTTIEDLEDQATAQHIGIGLLKYKDIEGGDPLTEIEAGKNYRVAIGFNPIGNYKFADDLKVKVNGKDVAVTTESDGSKKVKYEFECIGIIDSLSFTDINELANNPITTDDDIANQAETQNVFASIKYKDSDRKKVDYIEAGQKYSAVIDIAPRDGYKFADEVTVTINGSPADVRPSDSEGIKAEYYFDCIEVIDELNFTGIKELPGTDLTTDDDLAPQAEAQKVYASIKYKEGGDSTTKVDHLEGGKAYKAVIDIAPRDGYKFADDLKVTVNGLELPVDYSKGTKVRYNFYCKNILTPELTPDNNLYNPYVWNINTTITGLNPLVQYRDYRVYYKSLTTGKVVRSCKDPGTYEVVIVLNDRTFKDYTFDVNDERVNEEGNLITLTYTIKQAPVTANIGGPSTVTYSGEDQTPEVSVRGAVGRVEHPIPVVLREGRDYTVSYEKLVPAHWDWNTFRYVREHWETVEECVNAGKYHAVVTLNNGSYYLDNETAVNNVVTLDFEITKKQLSYEDIKQAYVFDGEEHFYEIDETNDYLRLRSYYNPQIDAGVYEGIRVELIDTENYEWATGVKVHQHYRFFIPDYKYVEATYEIVQATKVPLISPFETRYANGVDGAVCNLIVDNYDEYVHGTTFIYRVVSLLNPAKAKTEWMNLDLYTLPYGENGHFDLPANGIYEMYEILPLNNNIGDGNNYSYDSHAYFKVEKAGANYVVGPIEVYKGTKEIEMTCDYPYNYNIDYITIDGAVIAPESYEVTRNPENGNTELKLIAPFTTNLSIGAYEIGFHYTDGLNVAGTLKVKAMPTPAYVAPKTGVE